MDIVGTPTNCETFSASMSCRASSASHLCMSTTLRPSMKERRKIACEPVAWKRGTGQITASCNCFARGTPAWPLLALASLLAVALAAAAAAMPPAVG